METEPADLTVVYRTGLKTPVTDALSRCAPEDCDRIDIFIDKDEVGDEIPTFEPGALVVTRTQATAKDVMEGITEEEEDPEKYLRRA